MSIHTLSDLAVQDISDESAAVHSGGVVFTWYNDTNGVDFNNLTVWSDNVPVGYQTTHSMVLGGADNDNNLESFEITEAQPGRTYLVEFFDGNDGETTFLGQFTLDHRDNGIVKPLALNLRNRTSSLVITRIG